MLVTAAWWQQPDQHKRTCGDHQVKLSGMTWDWVQHWSATELAPMMYHSSQLASDLFAV